MLTQNQVTPSQELLLLLVEIEGTCELDEPVFNLELTWAFPAVWEGMLILGHRPRLVLLVVPLLFFFFHLCILIHSHMTLLMKDTFMTVFQTNIYT